MFSSCGLGYCGMIAGKFLFICFFLIFLMHVGCSVFLWKFVDFDRRICVHCVVWGLKKVGTLAVEQLEFCRKKNMDGIREKGGFFMFF